MKVYCGLCGHKAHELFTHVRNVHELTTDKYRERCPGAPLASEELVRFVRENGVRMTPEGPRKEVDLFGFQLMADLVPTESVPAPEEEYFLREDLGRLVTASLKDNERLLLVGPTGIGKSTLIEQVASRLNWGVVRVAASGGLTEADLLGEWTVHRKVLFCLTDGKPVVGAWDEQVTRSHACEAVERLTGAGIEPVGIGIMETSVRKIFPRHAVIHDLDDLASGFARQLCSVLTERPGNRGG